MKKLFYPIGGKIMKLFICLLALSAYAFGLDNKTASQVLTDVYYQDETKTSLVASSTACTASWANFGTEIEMEGRNTLGLFSVLTINSSADFRIRLVGRHTSGGTNHLLNTETTSGGVVTLANKYYEVSSDTDQNIFVEFATSKLLPYAIFQIQCGTVGSTAATLGTASYIKGWK